MTEQKVDIPPGHVALTTNGLVTAETLESYAETRIAALKSGLTSVSWPIVYSTLVDNARNMAVANFLRETASYNDGQAGPPWLMFIDADMRWNPDAVLQVLRTAYIECPWASIVGAWCPLRGKPFLPTIDPGSGLWEPIEPGVGPVEVMRTGSAFILIKRPVYQRLQAPWYGTRPAPRPLDVMQELHTFALTKFDGKNPLEDTEAWQLMLRSAQNDPTPRDDILPFSYVGEDSNLCDRARAAGFRIVVNTDAVIGHVERRVITPQDHLDAMKEARRYEAAACGVLEDD